MTYSPWRGEAARRAAAALPSGGRELSVDAVAGVVAIAAAGVAESWPAWTLSADVPRRAQAEAATRAASAGRSERRASVMMLFSV
jgi:hypothetical protein